jgi:hypothetical protein
MPPLPYGFVPPLEALPEFVELSWHAARIAASVGIAMPAIAARRRNSRRLRPM